MIPKYKPIKKRGSLQDIFFMVFFGVLFLTVFGFLIVSNIKISQKRSALNSQAEQLKAEIKEAQERKIQLEAQISQSSSQDYLEKEAREKFNLKKPGEEVVGILATQEEEEKYQTKQTIWSKILEKLKF